MRNRGQRSRQDPGVKITGGGRAAEPAEAWRSLSDPKMGTEMECQRPAPTLKLEPGKKRVASHSDRWRNEVQAEESRPDAEEESPVSQCSLPVFLPAAGISNVPSLPEPAENEELSQWQLHMMESQGWMQVVGATGDEERRGGQIRAHGAEPCKHVSCFPPPALGDSP